ncbi:MAG TPA: aminotransferase class V-fold PLP-dependent enzyme [Kofleriaceae bacterium]|jgi:isopenicillin-N epimerase
MTDDHARGALLGLAVGDALGTTYEFERLEQPAYPALATGPATDVVRLAFWHAHHTASWRDAVVDVASRGGDSDTKRPCPVPPTGPPRITRASCCSYSRRVNLADWALDPAVLHLNHGSYGGIPRAVLAAATALRTRLEASPMKFFVLDWQDELDRARAALAAFVRAPADRLVLVPNATTACAIALASLDVGAGDELLATTHGYRAVRNQLARLAAARGARIVTVPIALPYDPDATVAAIAAAITPRTKLAVLDHVTSPTALVVPIERLAPVFAARGIACVVDGAHAPGQLDLDVGALLAAGVTHYAGNNHKWLCAPKGSGFLVAAAGAPAAPVVTSHGASPEYGPANRFHAELDWAGTYDPIAHLCVPVALAEVARLGGGWPAVRARNHALAIELRARLIAALAGDARHVLAPDHALGAMAALPIELPPGATPLALQTQLLRDGFEVPIVEFATGPLVRVSAHLYNDAADADALAGKLRALGVTLRAR